MRSKSKTTDARIRKMVRLNSDKLPEDKWFVRKTVNRLPPSNTPVLTLPEIIAFLLVFIAGTAVVIFEMHNFLTGGSPSSHFDSEMLVAALFVLASSTFYMAASVIHKCR